MSTRAVAVALAVVLLGTSCSNSVASSDRAMATVQSLERTGSDSRSLGSDVWEVVVCRIPASYDSNLYDMTGVRLEQSAQWIAQQLAPVAEYFSRWSNGRYSLEFRAARREVRPAFGGAQECVEAALDGASPGVDGVLVVADAQHLENNGGGWGRSGTECTDRCPLEVSSRAMYVGASDFVGGDSVPLDLIEHEVGHALGWPHSFRVAPYDSVVDVMSDSASPQRRTSSRVHAPGVLAVNRYLSGWSTSEPIVIDSGRSQAVELDSERFALVTLSSTSALSVEVVAARDDNDHLERSGVVVHLLEWGADACSEPRYVDGDENRLCTGTARSQRLIAPPESRDGVMREGNVVEIAGVKITVETITNGELTDGEITATIRTARL